MKKKAWLFLLAMIGVCLIRGIGIGSNREAITVLWPQNEAHVSGPAIHLVLLINPLKVDKISFILNKMPPATIEMKKEKHKALPDGTINLCTAVNLEPGENKLIVHAYWHGNKIEEKNQRIYSALKSSLEKNTPLPGYQLYTFHTEKNEGSCIVCHAELVQTDKEIKTLTESPCYACHANVLSGKTKHGPVEAGDCSSCHTLSDKEKYAVEEPMQKLCSNCHEDAIHNWEAKKFLHAPIATGDCSLCHSPHSSHERFFLYTKINELCVSCHKEKATGRHVIASYVFGSSHPVEGKINPLKPENNFSCVSCHSPHASDTEKLFAFDAKGGTMSICQACHKK